VCRGNDSNVNIDAEERPKINPESATVVFLAAGPKGCELQQGNKKLVILTSTGFVDLAPLVIHIPCFYACAMSSYPW
jgi:hypothetical protein